MSLLRQLPRDPAPDKQKKMDGWMDGWMDVKEQNALLLRQLYKAVLEDRSFRQILTFSSIFFTIQSLVKVTKKSKLKSARTLGVVIGRVFQI